ncbi:MAG: DUF6985 domain-containing protein [Janthinobacterium lividum]
MTNQLAPIPALTWNDYQWEGTITLPEWQDFNQGIGAWKKIRAATLTRRRKREKAAGQLMHHLPYPDDLISLVVDTPDDNPSFSPEQVAAYHWLLAHEAELLAAMLAAFKENWGEVLLTYDFDDDMPERHSMPMNLRSPEELCGLLRLHTVYIKEAHTAGLAHVGLGLGGWDSEHGHGVYACGSTVLGIGSSDLASGDLDSAFIFRLEEE